MWIYIAHIVKLTSKNLSSNNFLVSFNAGVTAILKNVSLNDNSANLI